MIRTNVTAFSCIYLGHPVYNIKYIIYIIFRYILCYMRVIHKFELIDFSTRTLLT